MSLTVLQSSVQLDNPVNLVQPRLQPFLLRPETLFLSLDFGQAGEDADTLFLDRV